jgi:hypothetical protein
MITEEYHAQAAECLRQAEQATSAEHQLILVIIAQSWLRMVKEAEAIEKARGW